MVKKKLRGDMFVFKNDTPPPEDSVLICGIYVKKKPKKKKKKFADLNSKQIKKARSDLSVLRRRIIRCTDLTERHSVGYSALELKEHIEAQFVDDMDWRNIGEWHIDHIIPIYKYSLTHGDYSAAGFSRLVNNLDNLQPLWAIDNLKKSYKF